MVLAEKQASISEVLLEKLERNISGLERAVTTGLSSILKDRIRKYQVSMRDAGTYALKNNNEKISSAVKKAGKRYQDVLHSLKESYGDSEVEGLIEDILNPVSQLDPICCIEYGGFYPFGG